MWSSSSPSRQSYESPMTHIGSFGTQDTDDLHAPLLQHQHHPTPPTASKSATSTSPAPSTAPQPSAPVNANSTPIPNPNPYPAISIPTEHVITVKTDATPSPSPSSSPSPCPTCSSPRPPGDAEESKKNVPKKTKKPHGPPLTEQDKLIMLKDIIILGWARHVAIVFTLISVTCQVLVFCWHVARHHGLREIKELYSPSIRLLALYSICRLSGKYQRIITKRMNKKYQVICEEVAASWLYRAGTQYGEQIVWAILTFGFSLITLMFHLTVAHPSHIRLWHILVQYAVPVAIDLVVLIPIHFYIQHTRIHYIAKHSDTN